MSLNCGIVGLPNVGKSTIFNAVTAANAEAANYPFCTIEPNTGTVFVPDSRLDKLASIAKSARIIPTSVEFVDIAGLVKGASQGEGLGNQFLGHIRSVDAIIHVVRCFKDDDITHVHGSIDPDRDVEIIDTELMLADLSSVDRRIDRVSRVAKSGSKEAKAEMEALEFAKKYLDQAIPLRRVDDPDNLLNSLDLITSKPVLYVANVSENEAALSPEEAPDGPIKRLLEIASKEDGEMVIISGRVESEIIELPAEDREMFLSEIGLSRSGLDRLATRGYKLLNLITFFTIGPKEARAWTCRSSTLAPQAAGVIHTDFEKGFIRAEVIKCEDYIACNGESGARERGLLKTEGKEYVMKDGDVVHFRFNV